MSDASAAPAAPPAPGGPQQPAGEAAGGDTPQQPGAPTAAETRRLRLMLDGQEVELPEGEIVAGFKRGKNAQRLLSEADRRRSEALKAKAEAEGLLERLKKDPRGALRELGVDVRGLSEQTILEAIEEEKLTPDQRRARELERKLADLEGEKKKAEEGEKKKAHEAEVERHRDAFSNLFLETLEATGLPKSSGRHVLARMAKVYMDNEAAGLESTPDEMAAHVLEGIKTEHRGVLSGLEGPALLDYLGEDVVRKVNRQLLAQARAKRGMGAVQPAPQLGREAETSPDKPQRNRWKEIEALLK